MKNEILRRLNKLFTVSILCFSLIQSISLSAQNTDTTISYYTKEWKEVEVDDMEVNFFRKSWFDDSIKYTQDFDLFNNLLIEGSWKDEQKHGLFTYYHQNGAQAYIGRFEYGKKEGLWKEFHTNGQLAATGKLQNDLRIKKWKHYHENGKIAMTVYYDSLGKKQKTERSRFSNGKRFSKGNYKDGRKVGKWAWYHENGGIKYKGVFKNGYRVGHWKYLHPNGQLMADVYFEEDLDVILSYASNDSAALYFVEDKMEQVPSRLCRINWEQGFLKGEQVFYYDNGQMASKEIYKDGTLETLQNWDENGLVILNPKYNEYGTHFFPEYSEGNVYDFIENERKYPLEALKNNIQGNVDLNFMVYPDGRIGDFRILATPDHLLTQEAIRIIEQTNKKWLPGTSHNIPISRLIGLSIEFEID